MRSVRELLPTLSELEPSDAIVREYAGKALRVYEKMADDTDGRLADTLKVMRAARFFNYKFAAETDLLALQNELVHTSSIPLCYQNSAQLLAHVGAYKVQAGLAAARDVPPTLWDFWRGNAVELPLYFRMATEVSLITPSSGTIERVFSLLTQIFGDQQEGALEDYVSTTIKLNYNEKIWRARDATH